MSSRRLFPRSVCLALLVVLLSSCSKKLDAPLEALAKKFDRFPEWSIILQDMDRSGTFFKSYHHLYKVIYGEKEEGKEELLFRTKLSAWTEVSSKFFKEKESFLGMVLLSKGGDGKVSKESFPPGYQYIGNERYGQWRSDASGNRFWEFYGKYALFRDVLGMATRPIYNWDHDRYQDYRGRGQPYFGPSGNYYGTRGTHTQKTQPTFFQRQQSRERSRQASFSDKVRNRTGASGARSRSSRRSGK